MKDIKTTVSGILQWVVLAGFMWAKVTKGMSFSDQEMLLITSVILSGYKGIVSADAKPEKAP